MSKERRSDRRRKCRRIGLVTLESGPRIPVMVRDLSSSGARLTLAVGSGIHEQTDLALTSYRRGWWRMGRRRAVRAVGRVIRVRPRDDGNVDAAVRFHAPARIR